MLTKSDQYIEGAKLLHDNQQYCLSCHASYYSCLQYLKYKLHTTSNIVYKKNYDEQETEAKAQKKSSHDYLIDIAYSFIEMKKGTRKAKAFRRTIIDLKKNRVKFEYTKEVSSVDDSTSASEKAKEVIDILKQI